MNNTMEGEQWCNICSKMVSPIENKCPFCDTEFVVDSIMDNLLIRDQNDIVTDLRSAWVFSLYAPIFLGLLGALSPSLSPTINISSQEISGGGSSSSSGSRDQEEYETGNNDQLVLVRRRRTSTYMMHLFRGLHVRMVSESTTENTQDGNNSNNTGLLNNNIVVIDPFNEGALIVRGPNLNHTSQNPNSTIGTMNDFGVGSGFDLLLQHLAQIGPTGYAACLNPPTKKEAIESMASVVSEEMLQCTICLEDVEIGSEVKEMPCKHKFHRDCITSWLKLHSSCPVCRFQMPSEGSTVFANLDTVNGVSNQNNELVRAREERRRNGRRNWFPVLQSFNNFPPFP